jgi:hypothetical protein
MPEQIYVHRAVIVPGKRGSRVFPSLQQAPPKVRRVFENGSVVTIIIADRAAQELVNRQARREPAGRPSDPPDGLVREVAAAIALIGAIFYFALSR